MVNAKLKTDVSIFSGATGDSVTSGKIIPGNKRNIKSPALSPPRKYPITNQDIKILITEQDPSIPPIRAKYPPGFK